MRRIIPAALLALALMAGDAGAAFLNSTLNSATSNAAVAVSVDTGTATVSVSISGLTASGATLTVESSVNGFAYVAATAAAQGGSSTSTITADGIYDVAAAGRGYVRLRVSTPGTGTVAVASNTTAAPPPGAASGGGGGGAVTNAGTFATQDNGANTTAVAGATGTPSDAAWGGSGTATVVGALKALYAKLAGTLTVGGTVSVSGTSNVQRPDAALTGQTINAATPSAAYAVTLGNGQGTVSFAVSGLTASGATLTAEGSNDGGTTWSAINTVAPATGALSSTLTTDQQFRVNAAGRTRVRLRVSSTGTGTITVASNASAATGEVALSAPLPAGTNGIGSVSVSNLPSTQPVSGTIAATQSGTWNVGSIATLPALPTGSNAIGSVTSTVSAAVTNPTSVLTRPANTTAYAQNQLIASSTTAGSIAVPSVAIANSAGGVAIPRVRLATNKTTGWDTVTVTVRLWSAAPTYTNGDGGAYAVATGAAGFLASYPITLSQYGDGASGNGAPAVGSAAWVRLASGTALYWDVQYTGTASLTPASGQTFTLTAELAN